jgi:hypothetical protein
MPRESDREHRSKRLHMGRLFLLGLLCAGMVYFFLYFDPNPARYPAEAAHVEQVARTVQPTESLKPELDTEAYDRKMLEIAKVDPSSLWHHYFLNGTTTGWKPPTTASTPKNSELPAGQAGTTTAKVTLKKELWPVKAAYPNHGALLPFNRIVSYYGNFYSRQMGILGEYERDVVIAKLREQIKAWEAADPKTPVIPAFNYIAITAQASGGRDGMYRARMPDDQVDIALSMAEEMNGILFLEMQVGKSTLAQELPMYEEYFKKPNVHLAIDPEFSMKGASPPGTMIGTFTAADVNYAAEYLAKLVRENNLPPKILLVHRFTENMVTDVRSIKPLPEVQIVMVMDGWGHAARKFNTYNQVIASQPVQFTGFKLFYKADLREAPPRLLTPAEVLTLKPAPIYIQYQ